MMYSSPTRAGWWPSKNGPSREDRRTLSPIPVVQTVGGPRVQLKKYANHHWQLFVEGKPFPIKAITYSVTPVGLLPDRGTWNVSKDWQLVDTNHNGLHDGFFESYIDKNENGVRDPDEPVVGDAQLLKDLGVNTLRAYHHLYDKELFRRLYKEYGFYVLCGDVLGGYAVDSGRDLDGRNRLPGSRASRSGCSPACGKWWKNIRTSPTS